MGTRDPHPARRPARACSNKTDLEWSEILALWHLAEGPRSYSGNLESESFMKDSKGKDSDAQHRGVIRPKVRAGFSKGSLLLAIFPDHVADSTSGRILGGGIGVPVPEIGQSLETEFSRPERACAST